MQTTTPNSKCFDVSSTTSKDLRETIIAKKLNWPRQSAKGTRTINWILLKIEMSKGLCAHIEVQENCVWLETHLLDAAIALAYKWLMLAQGLDKIWHVDPTSSLHLSTCRLYKDCCLCQSHTSSHTSLWRRRDEESWREINGPAWELVEEPYCDIQTVIAPYRKREWQWVKSGGEESYCRHCAKMYIHILPITLPKCRLICRLDIQWEWV